MLNSILLVLGGLSNVVLVLLVAPLCEGLLRKLTARLQSRQGPPVLQPYYDLLKLLGKEDCECEGPAKIQRFSAYLSLASMLAVACFIPMGTRAPLQDVGDVVVLAYLLTLCAVATLLGGLAAGSTYSLLGINREMMSLITLEPLFAVTVIIGASHVHSLRLAEVLNGSMLSSIHFPWSGFIMLAVILFAFQAFLHRVPFDIAEAETELMDGPLVEYSGPKLALFRFAHMAKLVIFSALLITLFVPWGNDWLFPLNWLLFWLKVLALVCLITVIAATHARYRIDQALRFYASLLGISLAALVLAVVGY